MPHLVPDELQLLRHAAELRAEGKTWKLVASELGSDPFQLRQLAAEHARTFGSLSRHADRDHWRETINESVESLRPLLKSSKEEVVMAVGFAFLKYDLGKMRRATQQERTRTLTRHQRRRDELPPPPGGGVTVESTRCDSVKPEPEVEEEQAVIAGAVVNENARCDSVTVTNDRMTPDPATVADRPPTPPPPPVAKAAEPKWVIPIMGANRRRKWIPFDLRMVKAPPVASSGKQSAKKPPHIFDGRLTAILGP